jgi:Fe-S-cluster containining protein
LRFQCQPGCTACCEKQGFVYLTEDDIIRLADYLSLTAEAFEARYVFRTKHLRRLRVPRHAQCEFLAGGGCSVHAAKPTQCATFPYWPELLDSRKEWHKAGSLCPGIGKGELINIEFANSEAERMRTAHPHLYAGRG